MLALFDPWILAFSLVTVAVTIWMGFRSAKTSKSASDFFVAGRSVSVGWNASAISGEYLSAASFMGVAGMVMSSGYDALWYPVCYACGYLFLLLFIAGPLRRFGAYTIPDFAEGRYDSPVFRKIAVIFVLFIGFFYTMPQMKGAGTTLAYIFPGLPYWVGVVLVGAVITLNVALGGMKGITLVQAFQYWAKMFAISVPIFVLMAVYGSYPAHIRENSDIRIVINNSPSKELKPWIIKDKEAVTPDDDLEIKRQPLPAKAPADATWLNPFGPLTTKAAKAAKPNVRYDGKMIAEPLNARGVSLKEAAETQAAKVLGQPVTRVFSIAGPANVRKALQMLVPEKARQLGPNRELRLEIAESIRDRELTALAAIGTNAVGAIPTYTYRPDDLEKALANAGITLVQEAEGTFKAFPTKDAVLTPVDPKPYALLYTYSLIIALVCGTAGLPHILVRFYTNPDGVAAKRTTMWVMILIGIFYVFPPVFGVMGRNLMPSLYEGTGAKGTDKVVLELPKVLDSKDGGIWKAGKQEDAKTGGTGSLPSSSTPVFPSSTTPATGASGGIPWGSILSGITCAGAFAAFMSTFSGLLVSMTGALAHDVYGRMLRPNSTPAERMRMFKFCAVAVGTVAVVLGSFVEPLQINFMVGQAFAIAAASYFPLLFMSVWWRGMTMRGAAAGMLTGGVCALAAVTLTNFSDLKWIALGDFWAAHPLLRILCEQPAIWTVPLAIGLMVVVSKLTPAGIPADVRMKMLVLHAPEKLGLKQEYIKEHEAHGH